MDTKKPLHFTGRADLMATLMRLNTFEWRERAIPLIRMIDKGDEPRRAGRYSTNGPLA